MKFNKYKLISNIMVKINSGFSFGCIPMGENVVVAVVDNRLVGQPIPVALVADIPQENVQMVVNRAISLYKNHQVISTAASLDDFNRNFDKIA